jgi:hypothetical protein
MSVISGRGLSVRTIALGSVTALAALAAVNQQNAINAQRKYPPQGDFLRVRGVRLHKVDTGGPGPAVVLLHGNGVTSADMEISGLIARAARRRRAPVAPTRTCSVARVAWCDSDATMRQERAVAERLHRRGARLSQVVEAANTPSEGFDQDTTQRLTANAARHRSYRSVARVAWCDSDATMRQERAVADGPLGTFNVARGVFSHPVFAREPFTEREACSG